ncbi:MAG: amidohydrolase [Longimicrobiales bacterium]
MPARVSIWWGSGPPVIGILAEFDALPGITQDAVPERAPLPEKGSGHACGHHLFGTGSVGAAIATREWLEATGTGGTIRLYGTPAEEGGAGKVYLVREGYFDDVDAVLHWHAGDGNSASPSTSLANKSGKFRFRGISAHAAAAPDRGRSALDGVEAMNYMVNLMREHVPQETRIHYVITNGGSAPNVIPDFAEVFYYVRNPDPETVQSLFDRVVAAAEGAAQGTETEVEYEVIHGLYNLLPNETLQRVMWENLNQVGGVQYDETERRFAEVLRKSLPEDAPPLESAGEVRPYDYVRGGMGSTDVADVSWVVPTAGLRTATWVPGTASHSWQAVAAGGTSIGTKGMLVAAKILSLTALEIFSRPELVEAAQAELRRRAGPDFVYQPLLGDRDPPLDYRVIR